jgi:hypothetical protein
MQRHYKGKITIAIDSWGEDEEEAIENYFCNLKGEEAEVLESDLDCVEEDDTDDEDYYRDMEFDNWRERMNES